MRLSQPTPPKLPDVVAAIDTALRELDGRKEVWRQTSIDERLALLDTLRVNTDREAQRWVDAAVEAKGIPKGSPLEGEEWMSGPLSLLIAVDHLGRTLRALRDGKDVLQGSPVRTRPDGQVVVRVFPGDRFESLLMPRPAVAFCRCWDVTVPNENAPGFPPMVVFQGPNFLIVGTQLRWCHHSGLLFSWPA